MTRFLTPLIPIFTSFYLLCGCADYKDILAEKGEAEYTIILYGCGGGNLDDYLDEKLRELFKADYSKSVNVSALVKFSKEHQHKRKKTGTRRYSLYGRLRVENEYYADNSFRLDSPENFATFIAETKALMPAKKYILILWNHGEEFSIFDQPIEENRSKAILYDDNIHYASMSIFELERALSLVDTPFDAIILDACRMASAEYLFQIKDYTKYILASSHNVYGGLFYNKLVHYLDECSNICSALNSLGGYSVRRWSSYNTSEAMDISLFDMDYADNTLLCIGKCVDALHSLRNTISGDKLERYNRLNGTSQSKSSPFYSEDGILYYINPSASSEKVVESVDMAVAFRHFSEAFDDSSLKNSVKELDGALDKMIVAKHKLNIPSWATPTSFAFKWCYSDYFEKNYTKEYIERVGQEPLFPTLKDIYPYLEFDKHTSWSRFLEGNMLIR